MSSHPARYTRKRGNSFSYKYHIQHYAYQLLISMVFGTDEEGSALTRNFLVTPGASTIPMPFPFPLSAPHPEAHAADE